MYTVPQISAYMMREKMAIHGVSPETYQQNQRLLDLVSEAHRFAPDTVIATQLIGSRSNGTSGLGSDLDLAVVGFDEPTANAFRNELKPYLEYASDISVDTELAAACKGIDYKVFCDPRLFVGGVLASPATAACLFENGVVPTPNAQLGQLAALSVILKAASTNRGRLQQWSDIRLSHQAMYLGDAVRMREKLIAQLGDGEADAVKTTVTDELVRGRWRKFALPENVDARYRRLSHWASANVASIKGTAGYELYQGVLKELR